MVTETAIVCPVCWDHAVERIEALRLSANTNEGRAVGGAFVYPCSQWHVFALFDQTLPFFINADLGRCLEPADGQHEHPVTTSRKADAAELDTQRSTISYAYQSGFNERNGRSERATYD